MATKKVVKNERKERENPVHKGAGRRRKSENSRQSTSVMTNHVYGKLPIPKGEPMCLMTHLGILDVWDEQLFSLAQAIYFGEKTLDDIPAISRTTTVQLRAVTGTVQDSFESIMKAYLMNPSGAAKRKNFQSHQGLPNRIDVRMEEIRMGMASADDVVELFGMLQQRAQNLSNKVSVWQKVVGAHILAERQQLDPSSQWMDQWVAEQAIPEISTWAQFRAAFTIKRKRPQKSEKTQPKGAKPATQPAQPKAATPFFSVSHNEWDLQIVAHGANKLPVFISFSGKRSIGDVKIHAEILQQLVQVWNRRDNLSNSGSAIEITRADGRYTAKVGETLLFSVPQDPAKVTDVQISAAVLNAAIKIWVNPEKCNPVTRELWGLTPQTELGSQYLWAQEWLDAYAALPRGHAYIQELSSDRGFVAQIFMNLLEKPELATPEHMIAMQATHGESKSKLKGVDAAKWISGNIEEARKQAEGKDANWAPFFGAVFAALKHFGNHPECFSPMLFGHDFSAFQAKLASELGFETWEQLNVAHNPKAQPAAAA